MLCDAYFGELQPDWKKKKDPSEVLKTKIPVYRGAHDLLSKGSRYFTEETQIDWGSFAWKCTKEEMDRFIKEEDVTFQKDPVFEDGKEYGMLFLDSGFSGEDLYD